MHRTTTDQGKKTGQEMSRVEGHVDLGMSMQKEWPAAQWMEEQIHHQGNQESELEAVGRRNKTLLVDQKEIGSEVGHRKYHQAHHVEVREVQRHCSTYSVLVGKHVDLAAQPGRC